MGKNIWGASYLALGSFWVEEGIWVGELMPKQEQVVQLGRSSRMEVPWCL